MSTPSSDKSESGGGPVCPVCAGAAEVAGPVFHPEPALVAGVPIDLAGLGPFLLMRCTECGFQFKARGFLKSVCSTAIGGQMRATGKWIRIPIIGSLMCFFAR